MEVLGRLCLPTQSVGKKNPSGHSAWGQPELNCKYDFVF